MNAGLEAQGWLGWVPPSLGLGKAVTSRVNPLVLV